MTTAKLSANEILDKYMPAGEPTNDVLDYDQDWENETTTIVLNSGLTYKITNNEVEIND